MTTPGIDLGQRRRVHLVGIGGAGMSGIARMLLERGHLVSGSDLRGGRVLFALDAMGARTYTGHGADQLGDAEVVVTSTAVPTSNPELVAAAQRGLPVVHRAEMLAALMAGHTAVLVAGTHGKTTTTSMVAVALQAAGQDPSFAIGGSLSDAGSNAHSGTGAIFVAEADESDRSFFAFRPDVAVVTNLEHDHHDTFPTLADVEVAFRAFLAGRADGGTAVVCLDDPGSAQLAEEIRPPVVTYGEAPHATVRLVIDGSRRSRATSTQGARLAVEGETRCDVRVGAPGRHNLLNATGALAVCWSLGVDLAAAATGLETFTGATRRFQVLGTVAGVTVVDDYAHHPTELRATVAAARTRAPRRVIVVVQPHRYSRTAALGGDLGRAAADADLVIVTEVYAAGEAPMLGVSGATVADGARAAGGAVQWLPHLADVVPALLDSVRDGDLVLVTGAGDVTQVGPTLLEALRVRHG